MRPPYAHESYVFHVTLEALQELQIHMVMFGALGDLDTAVDLGYAVSSVLDLRFGGAAY